MPGVASDTIGNGAIVPLSEDSRDSLAIYPLHHGLTPPVSRVAISWSRGNTLRISLFASPSAEPSRSPESDSGGEVLEVKLGSGDPEITDVQWRRFAYGSVAPFALLQSRRSAFSVMLKATSPYNLDW